MGDTNPPGSEVPDRHQVEPGILYNSVHLFEFYSFLEFRYWVIQGVIFSIWAPSMVSSQV